MAALPVVAAAETLAVAAAQTKSFALQSQLANLSLPGVFPFQGYKVQALM